MVLREISPLIKRFFYKRKTIILYGARQTGKTTLIEQLLEDEPKKILFLNGDDAVTRDLFSNLSAARLFPVIGNYNIVVIDEAQRIQESGLVLKIIHDNFKDVQLIASGSSSFELANKINEPMTGRKVEFMLYPFSFKEMCEYHSFPKEKSLLDHRLIFGYYPDIALNPGNEKRLLKSLASSYLYKDLLILETIHKPVLLEKILKALALQLGNEVTYNELAQLTDSNKDTVEKYIDLLEKAFIIFKLNAYSRNVRNEIKKGRKIYFYDNGIRNAILSNFTPLDSRPDKGALWENFIISERLKFLSYNDVDTTSYFWRTTQQQEIDYLEEYHDKLLAFEFKWNPKKQARLPKTFRNAYPNHEFKTITPDNMYEFLLK